MFRSRSPHIPGSTSWTIWGRSKIFSIFPSNLEFSGYLFTNISINNNRFPRGLPVSHWTVPSISIFYIIWVFPISGGIRFVSKPRRVLNPLKGINGPTGTWNQTFDGPRLLQSPRRRQNKHVAIPNHSYKDAIIPTGPQFLHFVPMLLLENNLFPKFNSKNRGLFSPRSFIWDLPIFSPLGPTKQISSILWNESHDLFLAVDIHLEHGFQVEEDSPAEALHILVALLRSPQTPLTSSRGMLNHRFGVYLVSFPSILVNDSTGVPLSVKSPCLGQPLQKKLHGLLWVRFHNDVVVFIPAFSDKL